MFLEDIFFLTLILFLGYLLRYIFLITPKAETSDKQNVFYHLKKHKNSKWINYKSINSVNDGNLANSQFLFFLISKFIPENHWMRVSSHLNFVFDIITGIIVYIISKFIFISHNFFYPEIFCTIIYLTTPILMPINGRIMGGPKARSFGGLLIFIYFLCLFYSLEFNNKFIILCFILGYFIIISSVFATQVFVIFSFILFCFYKSILIVIPPFLIFLLYFVPGLKVKEVINYKIAHFKFFYKTIESQFVSDRNNLEFYKEFLLFLKCKRLTWLAYHKISPLILILSFPIIFFIYEDLFNLEKINGFFYFCKLITLSSIITFILTSFRPFVMIGQAERYLEYSAPFASILFINVVDNSNNITILLFINVLLVILNFVQIHKFYINQTLAKPHNKDTIDVSNYLKKEKKIIKVLSIPFKITRSLSYLTFDKKNILYFQRGVENKLMFYEKIGKVDDYPDYLNNYIQNFKINRLVVLKDFHAEKYKLHKYKKVYENGSYRIYNLT